MIQEIRTCKSCYYAECKENGIIYCAAYNFDINGYVVDCPSWEQPDRCCDTPQSDNIASCILCEMNLCSSCAVWCIQRFSGFEYQVAVCAECATKEDSS